MGGGGGGGGYIESWHLSQILYFYQIWDFSQIRCFLKFDISLKFEIFIKFDFFVNFFFFLKCQFSDFRFDIYIKNSWLFYQIYIVENLIFLSTIDKNIKNDPLLFP